MKAKRKYSGFFHYLFCFFVLQLILDSGIVMAKDEVNLPPYFLNRILSLGLFKEAYFLPFLKGEIDRRDFQKLLFASDYPVKFPAKIKLDLIVEKALLLKSKDLEENAISPPVWEPISENKMVMPGDQLKYTVIAKHIGDRAISNFVILQAIPKGLEYQQQSKTPPPNISLTYSIDQGKTFHARPWIDIQASDGNWIKQAAPLERYTHIRWQLNQDFLPEQLFSVSYELRVR